MTTPEPGVRDSSSLPSSPPHGLLQPGSRSAGPAVAYAFSERADGTMSDRVGAGDHRRSRAAVAARVGLDATAIAWMDQVHGDAVVVVGAPAPPGPAPACDGIVSTAEGIAAGVVVADCVPVLMAAPHGVAAVHAGRPGVVVDVAGKTLDRLCRHTGAAPADVAVVIGPAIGPCCYEVPEPMAADVDIVVPGTRAATTWGTPSLDLVGAVVGQLRARGVDAITRAGGCTRCSAPRGRWFSHRATTGTEGRPAGRQAGVVVRLAAAGTAS